MRKSNENYNVKFLIETNIVNPVDNFPKMLIT